MYIIYFFAALAFIITVILTYIDDVFDFSDPDFYSFTTLITMVGAFVGFLVSVVWSSCTFDKPENVIHKTENYEIICLQDNKTITGDFFLGCGSIDGHMAYTFYYKDEKNDIRGEELPYDYVVLQYTKDKPKYEISYDLCKESPYRIIYNGSKLNKQYRIYIPEGTILQNYSLDAN